jgi:dimethylargininase
MRALVRSVPSTYQQCLRSRPVEIDVELARLEHAGYVAALERAGLEVTVLPALDSAPDSVFVEDAAVVLDETVVITRPGAASRQGEGASLVPHFVGRAVELMTAPATLDGGDVLRVGQYLFVGLSSRTNIAGFEMLAAAAAREGIEAVQISVAAGLHLKSACSRLGNSVIGHFDRLPREPFLEREILLIEAPDEMGANVLELGSAVLVSSAAPKTAALAGARAIVVDVGEFHKGDGALTCLSILV